MGCWPADMALTYQTADGMAGFAAVEQEVDTAGDHVHVETQSCN
jgi:hypothetical protein